MHQAQKIYNCRATNEKKKLVVSSARRYAEGQLDGKSFNNQSLQTQLTTGKLKPSDFVSCVEDRSTLNSPRVLISQVQSLLKHGQVSLLWYKRVSRNLYELELESRALEAQLQLQSNQQKNRPGVHRLHTSPRNIHKGVTKDNN